MRLTGCNCNFLYQTCSGQALCGVIADAIACPAANVYHQSRPIEVRQQHRHQFLLLTGSNPWPNTQCTKAMRSKRKKQSKQKKSIKKTYLSRAERASRQHCDVESVSVGFRKGGRFKKKKKKGQAERGKATKLRRRKIRA